MQEMKELREGLVEEVKARVELEMRIQSLMSRLEDIKTTEFSV